MYEDGSEIFKGYVAGNHYGRDYYFEWVCEYYG